METIIVWWLLRITGLSALAYALIISLYTIGWYRLRKGVPLLSTNQPRVNVLVALRNEAENVPALIHSLCKQQYPAEKLSFFLVDDHSTDATLALLKQHTAHIKSPHFTVVAAEKTGKKNALQQALTLTSGDLVMVTDADCIPEPYWIARTAAAFKNQQYVMLLGPVKIAPASSVFQQWQALEFMSLIASTAGAAGIGFPSMANGANMAFSRNELIEAGGFVQQPEIASGDDIFLLLKLLQKYGARKIQFLMAEDSIVYTKASPNWHSFLKQRMRWVSKSKAYRHPNILVPATVVLVFNLLLVFLLAASVFYPYLLLVFTLFVLLKYLVDLPILQAVAGFMKSRDLLRWAFPMQLVYPFYVLIASVAGLLFKSSWKGRK